MAAACGSTKAPVPPDPNVAIDGAAAPLNAALQATAFQPVRPPRADYGPGTVLTADGKVVAAGSRTFPPASILAGQPVAFLRNYHAKAELNASGELLVALGAKDSDSVKAQLASAGVSDVAVTLGECVADVLPLVDAQRELQNLDPTTRSAILGGQRVIVEAIRVTDASITFFGSGNAKVGLNADLVSRALANSSVSSDSIASQDYKVSSIKPVYIGMKTHVFRDTVGEAADREVPVFVSGRIRGEHVQNDQKLTIGLCNAVEAALGGAGYRVVEDLGDMQLDVLVACDINWDREHKQSGTYGYVLEFTMEVEDMRDDSDMRQKYGNRYELRHQSIVANDALLLEMFPTIGSQSLEFFRKYMERRRTRAQSKLVSAAAHDRPAR